MSEKSTHSSKISLNLVIPGMDNVHDLAKAWYLEINTVFLIILFIQKLADFHHKIEVTATGGKLILHEIWLARS